MTAPAITATITATSVSCPRITWYTTHGWRPTSVTIQPAISGADCVDLHGVAQARCECGNGRFGVRGRAVETAVDEAGSRGEGGGGSSDAPRETSMSVVRATSPTLPTSRTVRIAQASVRLISRSMS